MIKFSDGVNIDTSGKIRKLRLSDGLYVVGNGMCIPVDSEEEAEEVMDEFKEKDTKEYEYEIRFIPLGEILKETIRIVVQAHNSDEAMDKLNVEIDEYINDDIEMDSFDIEIQLIDVH